MSVMTTAQQPVPTLPDLDARRELAKRALKGAIKTSERLGKRRVAGELGALRVRLGNARSDKTQAMSELAQRYPALNEMSDTLVRTALNRYEQIRCYNDTRPGVPDTQASNALRGLLTQTIWYDGAQIEVPLSAHSIITSGLFGQFQKAWGTRLNADTLETFVSALEKTVGDANATRVFAPTKRRRAVARAELVRLEIEPHVTDFGCAVADQLIHSQQGEIYAALGLSSSAVGKWARADQSETSDTRAFKEAQETWTFYLGTVEGRLIASQLGIETGNVTEVATHIIEIAGGAEFRQSMPTADVSLAP